MLITITTCGLTEILSRLRDSGDCRVMFSGRIEILVVSADLSKLSLAANSYVRVKIDKIKIGETALQVDTAFPNWNGMSSLQPS